MYLLLSFLEIRSDRGASMDFLTTAFKKLQVVAEFFSYGYECEYNHMYQ